MIKTKHQKRKLTKRRIFIVIVLLIVALAIAWLAWPYVRGGYWLARGAATEAGVLSPRVCIRELPAQHYLMGDVQPLDSNPRCDKYSACALTHDSQIMVANPGGGHEMKPDSVLASLPLCSEIELKWNERFDT